MPVAYTDLFNEALDDLKTKLETITGLQVVTDPETLCRLARLLEPAHSKHGTTTLSKSIGLCRSFQWGQQTLTQCETC